MTDTQTAPAPPPTKIKRHPIRGILWGLLLGLGAMVVTVGQAWAALGTWPPFLVFLGGVVIGFVWSMWGPAKKPKGDPPAATTPPPVTEPPAADTDTTDADAVDGDATDASTTDVDPADGLDRPDGVDEVAPPDDEADRPSDPT